MITYKLEFYFDLLIVRYGSLYDKRKTTVQSANNNSRKLISKQPNSIRFIINRKVCFSYALLIVKCLCLCFQMPWKSSLSGYSTKSDSGSRVSKSTTIKAYIRRANCF